MGRIGLIAHEPLARESLAGVLRSTGHTVTCALSAIDALAMVKRDKPDMLIVDVDLPRQEGLHLLDAARDNALSHIPMLMIASPRGREDIIALARRGAKHILLRQSFTLDGLHERIRACLADAPRNAEPRPVADAYAAPAPSHSAATAHSADSVVAARSALKDMAPLVTPRELKNLLDRSGELCALSPAVSRVIQLASRPDVSADEIAKVIKQDPAISMKILKLANSTVYTRGTPVDSVLTAVRRIGMEQIRQAVVNIGIVDQFAAPGQMPLDTHLFWEHSIAVGLFAAGTISALGGTTTEADGAFTMGLLHDVGRLVLARQLGERYANVIQTAREMRLPLEVVEKRLIGLTHAELMERMLAEWRFAGCLVKPVAMHHAGLVGMRHGAGTALRHCLAVSLGNRLAHAHVLGHSGSESMHAFADLTESLGLSEHALGQLCETVPTQVHDLKLAMLASAPSSPWLTGAHSLRARLPEGCSCVYVGDETGMDPCRILARVLGEACSLAPTIAIAGISSAVNLSHVRGTLEALDNERTSPLPTLIVHWGEAPDPSPLGARALELLPGPFQLESLVAAIQRLHADQT